MSDQRALLAANLRALALTSGNLGARLRHSRPAPSSRRSRRSTSAAFGDAGAVQLAKSPHLNRLFSLSVARCQIGPKSTKALAEAPWAANLVRLNLNECPIRKGGIDALVAPASLPRLRLLDVTGGVSNRARQDRLRARYGDADRF
jgi:hypothetical protein